MQNNRAVSPGVKDLPDLIIIGSRYPGDIHWVEIKVGRDRLSEGQADMGALLKKVSNYYVATENNYLEIFDKILSGAK